MAMARRERPVIGWREWIGLPLLAPVPTLAKIDSGARTSAIHSFRTRRFSDGGAPHVEFMLHPIQRQRRPQYACIAAVVDERRVRSSNGGCETRLVIETLARLGDAEWQIELTLANRDLMGFRMLLGRSAIRRRFLIDPARSFRQSQRLQEAARPAESLSR